MNAPRRLAPPSGRAIIHVRWFVPGAGAHVEAYDTGSPSDMQAWSMTEALKYPCQVVRIDAVARV